MKQQTERLRRGDLVEVKTPYEILQTLDADGALDHLPFMPEMLGYCGKRFQVARRALKTCTSGTRAGSSMLAFRSDDVVFLEDLRCSGADHDGCQKACMIFWREAWLRKVKDGGPESRFDSRGTDQLRARLKTSTGANRYFCQASELLNATRPLSRLERFSKCFREISDGNCNVFQMAQRIGIWVFWKIRRILLGAYGRGNNKSTPVGSLNLQAGDCVEVKSMELIRQTLNEGAQNRGLWFSPDMRLLCGQQQCVEKRIDKIIVDGTGEMRQLRNTVFLEGSYCGCPHVAFGGCPRDEYVYWREIWLDRVNGPH
jgi:hypothetical protein